MTRPRAREDLCVLPESAVVHQISNPLGVCKQKSHVWRVVSRSHTDPAMLRSCALLAIGAASAFAMDRLSMESDVAPATARFWTAVGPSDPTTQLKFTIAMRVEKAAAAKLERVFHEVSDPKNPMYGTPTSQLPISM